MSNWREQDLKFMRMALVEAERAEQMGEVPVGAVLVMGGEVIATGHNRSVADHDPAGHAEIVALRKAAQVRQNYRLNGATLYVTLEPCTMCIAALAEARIARLVFGAYDARAGAAGSAIDLADSKVLQHRMEVNGGILADECGQILKRFFAARR